MWKVCGYVILRCVALHYVLLCSVMLMVVYYTLSSEWSQIILTKRQAVEATVSETEELRNFLHNISVDGMLNDNMLKSLTWSTEAMDKVLLVSQMKCLVFLVMVQFHYNWLCRNLPFYYHDNKIGQYKFCGPIPYHRFNLHGFSLKHNIIVLKSMHFYYLVCWLW